MFPPVPAAAIAYAGYRIYEVVFPDSVVLLIAAGSILGKTVLALPTYLRCQRTFL